jgi:hypothetical protein
MNSKKIPPKKSSKLKCAKNVPKTADNIKPQQSPYRPRAKRPHIQPTSGHTSPGGQRQQDILIYPCEKFPDILTYILQHIL